MEATAAIAIAVAAVAVVFFYNRNAEAKTAAMIAAFQKSQYQPGGAIGFIDAFNVAGTVVSTYVGGPGAGASFAKGIK